jgi:cell division protein FtsZ
MDQDANVIWGARVSEEMKGKITVMTIITGVNSPWILGKSDRPRKAQEKARQLDETEQLINDELGIEIVQ